MKTTFLAAVLAVLAAGCGDIQDSCFVQRPGLGGYAVVLTQTAAPTGVGGGACTDPALLPAQLGDVYSIDKFGQDQKQVVVRPQSLVPYFPKDKDGNYATDVPQDAAHPATAVGTLTQDAPDQKHLCTVQDLSEAGQDFVLLDADEKPVPGQPIRRVKLSNLRFLSGALYQGTQLEVDATYTVGDCQATYHGIGLTPIVACASDTNCDPIGNLNAGTAPSGINPDYPVSCNTEVGALFPLQQDFAGNFFEAGGPVCWLKGTTFPQTTR